MLGFLGFSGVSPNEAMGRIPTLCVLGRLSLSDDLRKSLEKTELRLESPNKLTENENGPRLWALGLRFLSPESSLERLMTGGVEAWGGTKLWRRGNSLIVGGLKLWSS